MSTDPFTEAARNEAFHAWFERQPTLDTIADLGAHMAEWARDYLAAQEPTDAECIAFWHAFEDVADETNMENIRTALSAARAARREGWKR